MYNFEEKDYEKTTKYKYERRMVSRGVLLGGRVSKVGYDRNGGQTLHLSDFSDSSSSKAQNSPNLA
jgi:hypothetical protein